MKEKRYYWLKLEENYFDLKIQKALRKLPSGSDMLICYLKMQLKYLNTGGIIEFQGIYEDLSQELALDIDEDEDLVKMTLAVLEKWKVIEPCDSGIYIAEMQNRIGSKTDSALRVEKFRNKQKMLHCNNDVTKCNSIKDIDIEKDIDIDNSNNSSIYDFLQENGFILTPIHYEIVSQWEDNDLTRHAIKQAVSNNKYNIKYVESILNSYKRENIKTLQQVIEKEEEFNKNKNKNMKKFEEQKEPEWMGNDFKIEERSSLTDEDREFIRQVQNDN